MIFPDSPMLWYVCGPMSWQPQFNVPAFLEAAKTLKKKGQRAQLPADLDDAEVVAALMQSSDGNPDTLSTGLSWGDCLAMDVKLIADVVDGIVVLPGWHKSRGGRLETFVGRMLCGKPVVYYPTMRKVSKRQLAKAWLGGWSKDVL